MSDLVLSSVAFTEQGLEATFLVLPDDVRCDGQLVASRSYAIARTHPDFGEEVREVTDALTELIEDVHRGFASQPLTTVPEREDEDEGMGS